MQHWGSRALPMFNPVSKECTVKVLGPIDEGLSDFPFQGP